MSNALTIPDGSEVENMMRLANIFAESKEFKAITNQTDGFMRLLAARELGITATEAMSNIYTVNGVPCMDGRLMARRIRLFGFDYQVKDHTEVLCTIEFYSQPDSSAGKRRLLGESTLSMDDAKRAGWAGKDMYNKHPESMLFYRCISKGCRMFCPEINGAYAYTPDELEDSEPINITPAQQPAQEPVKAVAQKTAKALPPFAEEMNDLGLSKEDKAFIKADFKRQFRMEMPKTADITDPVFQKWLLGKAKAIKEKEGKPNEDETNGDNAASTA